MIALAVGLLVVGGLMTIFVQSSRSNREMARLVQQMENGRFALQLLREDLWLAGYWGEYNPYPATPTAMPRICTDFSTWTTDDQYNFLRVPVIGADSPVIGSNTSVLNGCGRVIGDSTDTTVKRKAGTDVLMVRHASPCIADNSTDNNCENLSNNKLYLQVSLCKDDTPTKYVLAPDPNVSDQTPFILRTKDSSGKNCITTGYVTTYAARRKVLSNIYYIRDDNTLMRSELDYDSSSGQVRQQPPDPLVEGIEHLEIRYGVDTNDDGSADTYVADPASLVTDGTFANNWLAWSNVMAIKLYLLARTLEASPGYDDSKVYQLGPTRLPAGSATGFHDAYKRHAYSAYVRLTNPAGRRDKP
jgi:type IV pilus assembly protein PilW